MRSSGFEAAYHGPPPPWEIGGPQPAVVRLAEAGWFRGSVLDVGCGSGDNALYLASLGLDVVGVDAAPTAIRRATEKADLRGLPATFQVEDALALEGLGRTFEAALDCGLFHTFAALERARYVESLGTVLGPGARLALLCFSDREPDWGGPRRVTEAELRKAFATGWRVDGISPTDFATRLPGGRAHAWLAELTRQ
ncbi:MAG: class I SAM-dependent methyltransferase [Candidatus Limnocylindrales bacterium]